MRSEMIQKARRLARAYFILVEYLKDASRYIRYSAPMDRDFPESPSQRHLEEILTKDYHRVEKALALRAPKSPFGREVEQRLLTMIPKGNSNDSLHVAYAEDALQALKAWNEKGERNGAVNVPSSELPQFSIDPEQLQAFFQSRRSVRDYDSSRAVDRGLLTQATELAINTPSVCNRQAWQVQYFSGPDAQRVLRHQNGNSGFGDQVPCVAVVSVDTRLFAGPGERHQALIDGGLFAMSLVWALHGLGLSTCMLNWSMSNGQTDALREEIGLESHHLVVTMIAIGYAPPQYLVARSPRRSTQEVMSIH